VTFNQLKYFSAVCKHNNISKAAEELFVSQPSVSIAIKELEEELHEKLFVRSNNKLYFTEAGMRLYKMAEDLLAHMTLIENSFNKEYQQSQLLKIGVFPDLTKWAFPYIDKVVAKLSKKYKNIDVELHQVNSDDMIRMIGNNYVDLAFCNDDNSIPNIFGTKKVHKTQMMVCMSKEHRLANEKAITIEMLADEVLIGDYDTPEQHYKWMMNNFPGTDVVIPKMKHFFLQNTAIHSLLVQNRGICFARPEMNGMSMDGVVAIPLAKPIYLNVALVYDNRYNIRDIVADFLDTVPVE